MSILNGLKIGQRLGAAFGVVVLVFAAAAGVSYWSTAALAEADRWNVHTYAVLGHGDDMLKAMLDMQRAGRGFMLAGDPAWLEAWSAGLKEFDREWGELKKMTADNPTQQARLDTLKAKHDEFRQIADALIAKRREVSAGRLSMDAFVVEFAKGLDKGAMDAFRAIHTQFDQAERSLLEQRAARAATVRATQTGVIVGGTALAIALAVAMGLVIARSITQPMQRAVDLARSVAQGDLTTRIDVHGRDETAELLGALRDM